MNNNLKYLTEKIKDAHFTDAPFQHIYIEDFFSEEHFNQIINSPQVKLPTVSNDSQLIDLLETSGYSTIEFPGCITDKDQYIEWHKEKKVSHLKSTSNEGFGMVFRLNTIQSKLLQDIHNYLVGEEFNNVVAEKFGVDVTKCWADGGIQKYLDGYEISPHPDIRKKATTFMVNINPSEQCEELDYHTHYMGLKDAYQEVGKFWEDRKEVDRCWVPWNWCDTLSMQTKNNSIVIFSPSNDTIHGVKANYNHLLTQRTQLYGNLWYNEETTTHYANWERLQEVLKLK